METTFESGAWLGRHLTNSALVRQGLTVADTTVEGGFLILNGCVGGVRAAGVVCSDDVLFNPTTPRQLRILYEAVQISERHLFLLTEHGRERAGRALIDEVARVGVLPTLLSPRA